MMKPGDRVEHIETGQRGEVVNVRRIHGGHTLVRVALASGRAVTRPEQEWVAQQGVSKEEATP